MQKFVSYLLVAAMIVLAALVSCNKDNKRPDSNNYVCIYYDAEGNRIGGDAINEEILDFIMYPNPTRNVVCLHFKTADLNTVTITDKRGKTLFEQSFDSKNVVIDVSNYFADTYRVTVDNGKQKSAQCLIITE